MLLFVCVCGQLVQGEMRSLSEGIRSLLGSDHPVLEACAKYVLPGFTCAFNRLV
jgi:hypothetical protein